MSEPRFPNLDSYLDPDRHEPDLGNGRPPAARDERRPVSGPCNADGCKGTLHGVTCTPQWPRTVTCLCDTCGRTGYVVTERSR